MGDIKLTFRALFLIGVLVLCLGFVLAWIPESGISVLKEQLSQATLSSDRVGLQQAITAENLNLVMFYTPISNILKVVGGLVITYSILTTTFNIALENRGKKTINPSIPRFMQRKPNHEILKIDSFAVEKNIE